MPSPQEREEALFRAAVELSADKGRGDFLDRECDGDPALRQRLDALLAAHDEPDKLIATQPGAVSPTVKVELAGERPDEAVGQTLGRYKLLERVGEGGCGVVYVAEQTERTAELVWPEVAWTNQEMSKHYPSRRFGGSKRLSPTRNPQRSRGRKLHLQLSANPDYQIQTQNPAGIRPQYGTPGHLIPHQWSINYEDTDSSNRSGHDLPHDFGDPGAGSARPQGRQGRNRPQLDE